MSRAISAELFKLRTTRTNWGVTLGALGLVALISGLAGAFGSWDPGNQPLEDVMEVAGLVQVFALVLGILVVATEYRHGTITPRCWRSPTGHG